LGSITNTISGMDEDLMHELNKAKAQEKVNELFCVLIRE